ncbi:MAG: hypothetical protein PUD16_07415 [bacterium]|nr:hypothetical protein [bacterium]
MQTFTNQASLSYNDTIVNSNITVGQITATLSITKTALRDEYAAGDNVTYVISIVNSGTTSFSGLTLTDDLGGYLTPAATRYPLTYQPDSLRYYVNGVLQTTPAVAAQQPLTITGVSVPAGGNAILVYEAEANGYAPLGEESSILNTVTLSGGGLSTALTANETVTPVLGPRLSITKSLSPTSIPENGQITYTFLIQNTGNAAAEADDNVVMRDTFLPILEGLTATLNGVVLTEGAGYTYDETTGLFATTPGTITVPAATFVQDPATGLWSTTPGTAVLVVTGTV